MTRYQTIHYSDELLSDGSVHRTLSDGRQEWRWRAGDRLVRWRDDRGRSGLDEALGRRIVKRTLADGQTVYGREQGYGRTAWSDGTLTVNRTSLGGRSGAILAAVGAGVLLGAIVAPPEALSAEEEEELRRQAQSDGGGGVGDGGGSGSGDDDWDDHDEADDDDFG
jgi:hypothetical protein